MAVQLQESMIINCRDAFTAQVFSLNRIAISEARIASRGKVIYNSGSDDVFLRVHNNM